MIDRGWKFYPAARVACALAAGIIAARHLAPSFEQMLVLLYCVLGWLLVALRRHIGVALPLHAGILLAGALLYTLRPPPLSPGLEGSAVRDAELIGRVAGEPVLRDGRVEFPVEPDSLLYRNSAAHPGHRVLVRLTDSTPFDPALIPAQGDHLSIVGTASIPSPPLNPGGIDYAAYLGSRGIGLVLTVWRASSIHIVRRGDLSPVERIVLPIRRAARAFAERHVRGEEGDIVRALLLGERDYIDAGTRDAFMRTGTVHVLAVSGFNVGLIALLLFVAVSWLPGRVAQLLTFAPLLALYVIVAGAEASLLRAAVMAVAFMLARLSSRIARPLNTLGVAALAILCVRPDQLFDIGFQLSFASVAGIVMLYAPVDRMMTERFGWMRRHAAPRWVVRMLLLSFAAQLFTLPLVLHHFGYLSLVSLIVNLPVIPLTSVALGAGVAGTLAQGILPELAGWFGGASHLALAATGWCVMRGAALPLAGVEPGTVGVIGGALLGIGVLHLALGRRPSQLAARGLMLAMLLASVLLIGRLLDPLAGGAPSLYLLHDWRGPVAATAIDDTVTLYTRGGAADSALLRGAGEGLRRRVGASALRSVRLDTLDDRDRSRLLVINDAPREYLLPSIPVILSNTAHRDLSIVDAFGGRYLLVPLKGEPDRALALVWEEGTWSVMEWE